MALDLGNRCAAGQGMVCRLRLRKVVALQISSPVSMVFLLATLFLFV